MIIFFKDALELVGERGFNLKIFKEISVTESFMKLDDNVRGCQDVEFLSTCLVKKYVQMKSKCGCVPLSLSFDDEVSKCKWPKETSCTKNILNETFPNCMILR